MGVEISELVFHSPQGVSDMLAEGMSDKEASSPPQRPSAVGWCLSPHHSGYTSPTAHSQKGLLSYSFSNYFLTLLWPVIVSDTGDIAVNKTDKAPTLLKPALK